MATIDPPMIELARDMDGNLVIACTRYPFTCVEIRLQDKAGNPLPSGEKMVNSFCFQIEGFGEAADLGPLFVRKVEIGYPRPLKPVMMLEELQGLDVAMVLDYSTQELVYLPSEAHIDSSGFLRWDQTKVDPAVNVYRHVHIKHVSQEEE